MILGPLASVRGRDEPLFHRVGIFERGDGRLTCRNGYRDNELKTRLGALNLRVPKLRAGSCLPGLHEPRRRSEKALVAAIQAAQTGDVSTRKVGGNLGHDHRRGNQGSPAPATANLWVTTDPSRPRRIAPGAPAPTVTMPFHRQPSGCRPTCCKAANLSQYLLVSLKAQNLAGRTCNGKAPWPFWPGIPN